MPPRTARILIASSEAAFTRLAAILSPYEARFAASFIDAASALESQSFDVVMIGLHFDESRMFELLHHIRSDPALEQLPVICFRGIMAGDTHGLIRLKAIDAACRAKGANDFFDLPAQPDAQAEAALRALIEGILEKHLPDAGS